MLGNRTIERKLDGRIEQPVSVVPLLVDSW